MKYNKTIEHVLTLSEDELLVIVSALNGARDCDMNDLCSRLRMSLSIKMQSSEISIFCGSLMTKLTTKESK